MTILIRGVVFAYLCLLAQTSQAETPVISNIRLDEVTHASARVVYDVTPSAYCHVDYGTVSGTYPYRSVVIRAKTNLCFIPLSGLAGSTTYYLRVTARPNYDNATDICLTSECGAVETVLTTPAAPATLREPEAPKAFVLPDYPDVTGYQTVTLTAGPPNQFDNCGLQAAINGATFGTIIEIPQGAICNTPSAELGFQLPKRPLQSGRSGFADPTHQWIIIRTARTPRALPPDGVRTGPQWKPLLASLRATNQGTLGLEGQVLRSNIYEDGANPPHHFWIDNINIDFYVGEDVLPADATDPRPYNTPIHITSGLPNQSATSKYIVLDRILLNPPPPPFRFRPSAMSLEGEGVALINSHFGPLGYWVPVQNTLPDPVRSGNMITQGPGAWQRSKGDTPWKVETPIVAQLNASTGYNGTFVLYLSPNGQMTIVSTTPTGAETANWTCPQCVLQQAATPAVPANRLSLATGTITAGQIVTMFPRGCSFTCEGSVGIVSTTGPGPMRIENNLIQSTLIAYYVESAAFGPSTPADVHFVRNTVSIPESHRITSTASNGWRYYNRNIWELKRGRRFLVKGNLFEGSFGDVTNNGAAVVLSPREVFSNTPAYEAGIRDIMFRDNIVRKSASAFYISGGTEFGGPNALPPLTRRVWLHNNLVHDIDGTKYTTTLNSNFFGNLGSFISLFLGNEGLSVTNNTVLRLRGTYPALFSFSFGPSEGLTVRDNILAVNTSFNLFPGILAANGSNLNDAFPTNPKPVSLPNQTSLLNSAVVRVTPDGVQPAWVMENNALIGGKKLVGTYPAMQDLSGDEVNQLQSTFPNPSANYFIAGATERAREQNLGIEDVDRGDFRVKPDSLYARGQSRQATTGRSLGADLEQIAVSTGAVSGARSTQGYDAAVLEYSAPDGRACTVEYGTSPNWGHGQRVADSGGARGRSVVLTGLAAETLYHYRILCAAMQPSGQLTTAATGGGSVGVKVSLNPVSALGIVSARLRFGTTPEMPTTTAPVVCPISCQITFAGVGKRLYYYQAEYLDDGGNVVRTSSVVPVIAE